MEADTAQPLLSKRAAPPRGFVVSWSLAILFTVLLVFALIWHWSVWLVEIAVLEWLWMAWLKEKAAHEIAMAAWRTKRVCLRCGTFFQVRP
jgi:hypothetical protein